jgi:Tol biopolymer transport system component
VNQKKIVSRLDYNSTLAGLYIASFALLIGIVSLINVGAQAPQMAQIAFVSPRDGNSEIYVMDTDGKNQRNLTNNSAIDIIPSWSPDGQKIAFTSDQDSVEDFEIYVMDADGKNPRNLTNNLFGDMAPSWSPDGQKISFITNRDGNVEVYVMDADGKNLHNLTNNPADEIASRPSWSPDGQKIAFASERDGNIGDIYVMDADGKNQHNLTNNPAFDWDPAWSPDGQKIAFASERSGNGDIYVMDVNGNKLQNLTGNNPTYDRGPTWSPDGQQIAFYSLRVGIGMGIYVMNADGKNPIRLTNIDSEDTYPDWFDPAFAYKAVFSVGKFMATWGWIKQGSE